MRTIEEKAAGSTLEVLIAPTDLAVLAPEKALWQNGFVLALVANILWGTTFLASKLTLVVWGPFTASVLRFTIAVLGLWIGFALTGRKIQTPTSLKNWLQAIGVGLTGFGLLYPLQLYGLKLIPSGLSAAIMLISPLILIIFGLLILGEPASRRKVVALFLGITGGVILLNPSSSLVESTSNLLLGSMLTLAAAATLALSVILTKQLSRTLDAGSITFWSMLIGLVILAPFTFFESQPQPADHNALLTGILALLYLGVICSVGCFLIWNQAIISASPKEIASTMHVKTPVAIVLGILIAGELLSLPIIIGTLIVTAGVWLSQSAPKETRETKRS